MTADRIVEPLDIVEHIRPGLIPGAIGFACRALGLERREEALHRRSCGVIFLHAPTGWAGDAVLINPCLPPLPETGILPHRYNPIENALMAAAR